MRFEYERSFGWIFYSVQQPQIMLAFTLNSSYIIEYIIIISLFTSSNRQRQLNISMKLNLFSYRMLMMYFLNFCFEMTCNGCLTPKHSNILWFDMLLRFWAEFACLAVIININVCFTCTSRLFQNVITLLRLYVSFALINVLVVCELFTKMIYIKVRSPMLFPALWGLEMDEKSHPTL